MSIFPKLSLWLVCKYHGYRFTMSTAKENHKAWTGSLFQKKGVAQVGNMWKVDLSQKNDQVWNVKPLLGKGRGPNQDYVGKVCKVKKND